MGVLLNEINRLFKTDRSKQVSRVSQTLSLEVNEHVLNVLDFLWLFQDVIEEHTLNFKVCKVAQVAC